MSKELNHKFSPHFLTRCYSYEAYEEVSIYVDRGTQILWAEVKGKKQLLETLPWVYKSFLFEQVKRDRSFFEVLRKFAATRAIDLYVKQKYVYTNPEILN